MTEPKQPTPAPAAAPAAKPQAHPPRQAKHPGRGHVKPHQRNTFQQEQHAHAMKRRAEPLSIARHHLKPHRPSIKGPHGADPKGTKP